jgi:hypothetical protein
MYRYCTYTVTTGIVIGIIYFPLKARVTHPSGRVLEVDDGFHLEGSKAGESPNQFPECPLIVCHAGVEEDEEWREVLGTTVPPQAPVGTSVGEVGGSLLDTREVLGLMLGLIVVICGLVGVGVVGVVVVRTFVRHCCVFH